MSESSDSAAAGDPAATADIAPDALTARIVACVADHAATAAPGRVWVAYSGGRDSSVLLHAAAAGRDQLAAPLAAVHVDHGLHPDAAAWSDHCRTECARLALSLECLRVDAQPPPGASPEAAARDARYAAIAALLAPGDVLLTAHHRDDQAETVLLQLLRGAGPHGLAAMPERRQLAAAILLRPLLDYSRAELAAWAATQQLEWIDDPSNAGLGPDRNYLRHQVLPLLQQRWPASDRSLRRAAAHQADASTLLDQLAALDAQTVAGSDVVSIRKDTLHIPSLLMLNTERQRNLLRYWLRQAGLRPPSSKVLRRVFDELIPARADAMPRVGWADGELRRYRDRLYLLAASELQAGDQRCAPQSWDLSGPLVFGAMRLSAERVRGQGLRASACADGVRVTSRAGGEACRALGDSHRRSLKVLLQQAGIPPWRRQQLALVWLGDELVQVVGLCIASDWTAAADEEGVLICVERNDR